MLLDLTGFIFNTCIYFHNFGYITIYFILLVILFYYSISSISIPHHDKNLQIYFLGKDVILSILFIITISAVPDNQHTPHKPTISLGISYSLHSIQSKHFKIFMKIHFALITISFSFSVWFYNNFNF